MLTWTGTLARRGHWLVGAVAVLYLPVIVLVPESLRPLLGALALALASGLSALVLWCGARGAQPADRRLRQGMAAGMTAAFVLNIAWSAVEHEAGAPALALLGPLYATTYACFAWAMLGLRQVRLGAPQLLRAGVDAVIVTASAALLLALAFPLRQTEGLTLLGQLMLPAFDVFLLHLVLAAAFGGLGRPPSPALRLLATLALVGAADLLYALRMSADTFVSGSAHELLWLVGWTAMASVASADGADRPAGGGMTSRRLADGVTVSIFVLAMVSVAVVVGADPMDAEPLMPTVAVLVLCAGWRQWQVVRDGHRLMAELHVRATTDGLTGLTNRPELFRMLQEPSAGAVVLVDLDGFKAINDDFGHAAGDTVLIEVADRLREVARSTDVVSRWGGDEFVIFMPQADEQDAERLVERVRTAVAEPLVIDGVQRRVGASVGVAHRGEAHLSAAAWLATADAAMYADKGDRQRQAPAAG